MSEKIGCSDSPCTTCPYRRDVPSGVWAKEEYVKLLRYDAPTMQQPASLFMCHQQNNSLCTGWLQSHAARDHAFDLLALRLSWRQFDCKEVSRIATMEPLVKLFQTGAAAAKHGMKALAHPGRKAKQAVGIILKKRERRQRLPDC